MDFPALTNAHLHTRTVTLCPQLTSTVFHPLSLPPYPRVPCLWSLV
jgi:hypothetical protein